MTAEPNHKTFGLIGVIAGFLALFTVLVGPSVYDAFYPKPPIEERIADAAVKIRERVTARLKGAPAAFKSSTPRLNARELPYNISLALAAASVIGGCVSYLRREDHRFAYVACGVGTLTLAWHAVLFAMGALVLCAILFIVFSSLGAV